ncbi:hypothetical protein DFH08DRAFT_390668 [Mycena albidolilacea]|uniref:Fungal N-terminal domain-containing protein n=1 Tax=Mycena albidolilacea TaxID=1033008 RepID=A0AAD6ZFZ5_9AGAR|nr:hypothetical protein DFH08DRAFT_390668 [Mycena albidolilacea]
MADIVSLIASVLQLVDAVAKGRRYIQDFRDAPKDQQRLLLEVQNLDSLLKALDTRVKNNGAQMQEIEGCLIDLKGMMERLTKKLDPKDIAHISSRLTWSLWRKEDVQEALDTIERFKSLVNAWLGVDVWDSAQGMEL